MVLCGHKPSQGGNHKWGKSGIMKTILNNLCSHISYERDGRLVHTDKKTGAQMVSIYTWPSLRGAREALANAFGKIQWQKFNESPRAPFKTVPLG
jgi:hypothetical protein